MLIARCLRDRGVTKRLPEPLVAAFDRLTDFGKSGWFLVPIGSCLSPSAVLASPALTRCPGSCLPSVAVRLGFLFVAIALPGLFVTIIKRLIGRARPFVGGSADPFLYRPFGWQRRICEHAVRPRHHRVCGRRRHRRVWPRTRA